MNDCPGRFLVLLAAVFVLGGAPAVTLVENGNAKCSVVLGDVGTCGAYGAADFADILRRLTGADVAIGNVARAGLTPVFFARRGNEIAGWPAEAKRAAGAVRDDGFAIAATPSAVYVFARESRGLAYAAYHMLRQWGGCRWFFPGPDGEYLPKASAFAIPDGAYVSNPSIPKRFFNFVCYNRGRAEEAFKWQLRNGMIVLGNPGYPNFERFGMFYDTGGHVFSTLLPDELFDEHPEYFCLVRGRRLPQSGKVDANGKRVKGSAQANQPCLSNPETLRIMRENLVKMLVRKHVPDQLTIINNDSRQWCECPACEAMAAPSERQNGGKATRYWTLVNDLLKTAYAYLPGLSASVLGYQDFQSPPPPDSPVRPDVRAIVPLAVHQRCYTHSMGDESCVVNARFRRMLAEWKKAGVKLATYEYTNCMPAEHYRYNPLERVVAEDIKYYARLGFESYIDEVPPYLADYNRKRWGKGVVEGMRANWLVHYVQARFLWDATLDVDAVVDDAGAKFYGRAWPAVKAYKEKLGAVFAGSGTHYMYGSPGRSLGRLLANDGLRAEVVGLLAAAEAAAKGDAALEGRVADERKWLEGSWLACVDDFKKHAGHVVPVVRASPPIDGDPEGAGWKDVPVVARDFKKRASLASAKFPTEAKVAWDDTNVYIGVTCFDPEARAVATRHTTHDSLVWEDNDVELFFAPAAFKGAEAHFAVNAAGAVYDALSIGHGGNVDKSFDSGVVARARVLDDRWTLTMSIPFAALNVKPVARMRIPFNIARVRLPDDPSGKSEVSSWNSFFHGPEVFHLIELAP